MGAPALMDAQSVQILSLLNALTLQSNFNVVGAVVADGGTTQATGAGTALNYDIDITAVIDARVDGKPHSLAAATDADATAGISFGAISGKTVVYSVVFETGALNDTPAWQAFPSAVYDTGSEVPLTDAEITTLLTHENWVRVADDHVNRTGDLTVTRTIHAYVRNPLYGQPLLSETEAEFSGS